jgi:hypothetical protein
MTKPFEIDDGFIAEQNAKHRLTVAEDYDYLGRKLSRNKIDIEDLVTRAHAFRVALPSWGVGTGGTRFARFPNPGEPRNVFEKLEDNKLKRLPPEKELDRQIIVIIGAGAGIGKRGNVSLSLGRTVSAHGRTAGR